MFELHDVDRPYPGLRPFESWEGEIFFGRRAHVDRLIEILARERFLAVIGPSGSGKSSLVRAGLLPELPQGRLGTGTRWRIATMRPGNEPIHALARALLQREALGEALLDEEDIPSGHEPQTLEVALLEAELRRGPLALVELLGQATERQKEMDERIGVERPPLNLLVLVDQFEELFTHLDAGTLDLDARRDLTEESDAFVNLLLTAAASDARVFVVLTLRTDFLGACVRFADLPDAINRAQYLTPRLRPSEIEMTITGPAHHFGGEIVPVVVQQLINAVGTDPDQLPILQHALSRMWTFAEERAKQKPGDVPSIVQDDFDQAGGLKEALSIHADSELAKLSGASSVSDVLTPEQQLARELFCAITEQRSADEGGQTVRRPQTLALIAARAKRQVDAYFPVVRAFSDESVNFIRYEGELSERTVIDISHEALIRQWARLKKWVADEARRAGEYRRLRQQARDYFAGEVGTSVLGGAALARALEWMSGSGPASSDGWRPDAFWAARYARDPAAGAVDEFEQVKNFIAASEADAAAVERRAADEIERRQQAEKAEIERRAMESLVAEKDLRANVERQRRVEADLATAQKTKANRLLSVAVAVALLLFVSSLVLLVFANGKRKTVETQASKLNEQTVTLKGQALWLPLSIEQGKFTGKDADALLQVVRADAGVIVAFAKELRDKDVVAERFLRAPAPVLTAMVGTSPTRARQIAALFESTPASEIAPSRARALSRLLVRASLDDAAPRDDAYAADLVAVIVGDPDDGREQWRSLGTALASSAPSMTRTRRTAMFQALQRAATASSPKPGQMLQLLSGMYVLRNAASGSERSRLFSQIVAFASANLEPETRPNLFASRSFTLTEEFPAAAPNRRDAVRSLLAFLARTLPEQESLDRWDEVWKLMQARGDDKDRGFANDVATKAPAPRRVARRASGEPERTGLSRADLGASLAVLSEHLPAASVPERYEQVLSALMAAQTNSEDDGSRDNVVGAYRNTLPQLAKRLSDERVRPEALRLLRLIDQTSRSLAARGVLLVALSRLIERADDNDAGDIARAFVRVNWPTSTIRFGSEDALDRTDVRRTWSGFSAKVRQTVVAPAWLSRTDVDDPVIEPAETGGRDRYRSVDPRLAIDVVLKLVDGTNDTAQLLPLGPELARLVDRVPAAQVSEIGDTLLDALVRDDDVDQRTALATGLAAAAGRLPAEPATRLRARVVSTIRATSADALWLVYAKLIEGCSGAACKSAADEMLGMLTNGASRTVTPLFVQVALRLDAPDAAALTSSLIASLAQSSPTDDGSTDSSPLLRRLTPIRRNERVATLEAVLTSLTKRLPSPSDERARTGGALVYAIARCNSAPAAAALARVLLSTTGGSDADRRPVIAKLIAGIAISDRAVAVDAMGTAAIALVNAQGPSNEMADHLLTLMNYPTLTRAAQATLRAKFPAAPREDAGYWALVTWAHKTWPAWRLDGRPFGLQAASP